MREGKLAVLKCKNPKCKREFTYVPGYTDSRDLCYVCMLKRVKK